MTRSVHVRLCPSGTRISIPPSDANIRRACCGHGAQRSMSCFRAIGITRLGKALGSKPPDRSLTAGRQLLLTQGHALPLSDLLHPTNRFGRPSGFSFFPTAVSLLQRQRADPLWPKTTRSTALELISLPCRTQQCYVL